MHNGRIRGILHVHSTYSYDGKHTLAEIAQFARSRGYAFVGMTEHSEGFNPEQMKRFVEECKSLSDASFLSIPGIEFAAKSGLHILGYGVEEFRAMDDEAAIADFICEQQGVAVVAHPRRYAFDISSQLLKRVHGIEVWNAAYDGRYVPDHKLLSLIRPLGSPLFGFCGLDMHAITNRSILEVELMNSETSKAAVLQSLRQGRHTMINPWFRFRSDCGLSMSKRTGLKLMRAVYEGARDMRDRTGIAR